MTTISLDNFWCPNKCLHDEQHITYVCIRVSSVFSGTSRLLQNRVLYHRLFSVLDLSDVRRKCIVCTYIRGGPCVTPKDNANISCFKDFPSRSQRCWCISATRKNRRLSWCCCSESIPYVSECLFPHENFLICPSGVYCASNIPAFPKGDVTPGKSAFFSQIIILM